MTTPKLDELLRRIGVDPAARKKPSTDAEDALAYLTGIVTERLTDATPPVFRARRPVSGGVRNWVNSYVANGSTQSLLLLGTTGAAKTHQAWWALRNAVIGSYRAGVRRPTWKAIKHTTFETETHWSKGADGEALLTRLCGADLLLFDDLGAARIDERAIVHLRTLVDERWENERPTIWTANFNLDTAERELAARTDDRIVSRLATAEWIGFDGDDFRRAES